MCRPCSPGAVIGRGSIRSRRKPSRCGTAALRSFASSQWITTCSTPNSKATSVSRRAAAVTTPRPVADDRNQYPISRLRSSSAFVEPGAAEDLLGVGLVPGDGHQVVEARSRFPLGDGARQELRRLLAGLVRPRHERAEVIAVLLDHAVECVDVVGTVPSEHDADVVDDDALGRTISGHHASSRIAAHAGARRI